MLGRGHVSHIVKGSTKILNFMTPGLGIFVLWHGHISYIVKIHYIFKNILLCSRAEIRQTEGIVTNDDQGRVYQNFTFHNYQGWGSCARAWLYKSYSENALFL